MPGDGFGRLEFDRRQRQRPTAHERRLGDKLRAAITADQKAQQARAFGTPVAGELSDRANDAWRKVREAAERAGA